MTRVRAGIAASLILCLLALASCGDDESTTGTEQRGETSAASTAPPAAVVAEANRNCRRMLRDVTRIGRKAKGAGYKTARELTTKGLAEPGMRLIKDLARRQQALRDEAGSPSYEAYASAFDPIIVLGEQWLRAQRELDFERADQLQELLTNRGAEQQVLARRAGLRRCSVDFLNAMVRSAIL
jgi:hypothetical protein